VFRLHVTVAVLHVIVAVAECTRYCKFGNQTMAGRLTADGSIVKEGKLVPQSYESRMHDHNTQASRKEGRELDLE